MTDANAATGLSAEQSATIDGWMVAAGHGDKIPSSPGVHHPAPATPAGSAATGFSPGDAPAGGLSPHAANGGDFTPSLSASEIQSVRSMADWSRGRGDHQTADELLKANGLLRSSPELQKLDAADMAVNSPITEVELIQRAGEYDFGAGDRSSEHAMAVEMDMRRTMARIGMSREEGSTFFQHVNGVEAEFSKLDDAGREIRVLTETAKLKALPGWRDEFPQRVKAINAFIDKLGPQVRQWLDDSGATSDCFSLNLIWNRIENGRHDLAQHRNKPRS